MNKNEKPKKLNIVSISIKYSDGKWKDLDDNQYEEIIFWDPIQEKFYSNSFILRPPV